MLSALSTFGLHPARDWLIDFSVLDASEPEASGDFHSHHSVMPVENPNGCTFRLYVLPTTGKNVAGQIAFSMPVLLLF